MSEGEKGEKEPGHKFLVVLISCFLQPNATPRSVSLTPPLAPWERWSPLIPQNLGENPLIPQNLGRQPPGIAGLGGPSLNLGRKGKRNRRKTPWEELGGGKIHRGINEICWFQESSRWNSVSPLLPLPLVNSIAH